MKNKEIQNLSLEQLMDQVSAEREQLSRLMLAHALSPIENPSRIRLVRRTIAKLETAITAHKK